MASVHWRSEGFTRLGHRRHHRSAQQTEIAGTLMKLKMIRIGLSQHLLNELGDHQRLVETRCHNPELIAGHDDSR